MSDTSSQTPAVKDCSRCGGRAIYHEDAMIPGDPVAPRGSHRGLAHAQPAWTCMNCGYVQPLERRTKVPRGETPPPAET